MPIDNRTTNLDLALPHQDNTLEDDVARLRSALIALDAAVFAKASPADIAAAINAVLDGAPAALDTLNELAAALGDNADYAASITSALAGKAPTSHAHAIADVTGLVTALAAKLETVPVASAGTVGGVRVGTGLSIDGAGIMSATGAGVSNTFTELTIVPASNGQTVFTPAGGYTVAQIELFLNGVLLYGGGDDYTAADGTTITLTTGANTVDTLLLRKWAVVAVSGAVLKTGDTMTGPLEVPAGASGTQAPRVQEVAKKAGDTMTGNLNFTRADKGTVGTGTVTFDVGAAGVQRLQVSGALTIAFSNWPASGTRGGVMLQLVNAGSAAVTLPTINWIKPDGTVTTTFSAYLTAIGRPALQTSGTDFAVAWSLDGGTTVYGKLL